MNKLPLTKEQLLYQYRRELDNVLDECEWISTVDGPLICRLISMILGKKDHDIDSEKLYKLYSAKVESLNLTYEEWCDVYCDYKTGVPKIIDIIYEILENNFPIIW